MRGRKGRQQVDARTVSTCHCQLLCDQARLEPGPDRALISFKPGYTVTFSCPQLLMDFPLVSCCFLFFILLLFTSEPESALFRPNEWSGYY